MTLFDIQWRSAAAQEPELQHTMAELLIQVGGVNLTKNENIWSRSVHERVLVSAYPLALWLAGNWWRLLYESLPQAGAVALSDWRMAHELSAVNAGFIWPQIILASDKAAMQIWAPPAQPPLAGPQSVSYLNFLHRPAAMPFQDFVNQAEDFIESVLQRLTALDHPRSELAQLWQEVQTERRDLQLFQQRKLEAELGFDPDECPEALLAQALDFAAQMGEATLSEMMPLCSRVQHLSTAPFEPVQQLLSAPGVTGQPQSIQTDLNESSDTPQAWQQAQQLAQNLRAQLGLSQSSPISNLYLYELLGLPRQALENFSAPKGQALSLVTPTTQGQAVFRLRKNHPLARRFELARLLGDHLLSTGQEGHWLTSTDTKTYRQKFQRAFAAAFLVPIAELLAFTDGDFSETTLEEAALHFEVSEATITSILLNHTAMLPEAAHSRLESPSPYDWAM